MSTMNNQLTFGACAALLRANGYAPAPLATGGHVAGPFAVVQTDYARYAENDGAPVAVLTAIPLPRNELEPVQGARGTWLAKLTVNVRAELVDEIDAIVKRYAGAARCPVLIEDDGSMLFVFRTVDLWGTLSAGCDPDHVRIVAGPSCIPVAGNWRSGIDLLTVARGELPELDRVKADELVNELGQLLQDRAAPLPVLPPPSPPKPLLQPGERLLFGNTRAMRRLSYNGFTVCPVSLEDNQVPKLESHVAQWVDGFRLDDERYSDFGVGLITTHTRPSNLFDMSAVKPGATWLAELEVRARTDIAAAIHSIIAARYGQGPIRIASDGSRLYLFKRVYGMPLAATDFIRSATGADGYPVIGSTVRIRIASAPVIVLSGADDAGKPYRWERGDPLTVARDDLPALDGNLSQWFLKAVEQLLASGKISSTPAPKRGRKAAAIGVSAAGTDGTDVRGVTHP